MEPLLSVIIPVGPAHRLHCRVAAASALAQTVAPWGLDVVICPDADVQIAPMRGVTILDAPGHRTGPAATRNRGIARARGTFVLFLDADDYLLPESAEIALRRYAWGDVGYVYGDAYTMNQEGVTTWARSRDYVQQHLASYNVHTVTALVPRTIVQQVGGFDEEVDAWEDWTLWLRLAQAGYCGARTPLPLFVYRLYEGERMTKWYGTHDGSAAQAAIVRRYQDQEGRIVMAGCCGGDPTAAAKARGVVGALGDPVAQASGGKVLLEFHGDQIGSVPIRTPLGNTYRFGNNASGRYAYVDANEVAWLGERVAVRVVPQPPAATPPPAPLAVDEGAVAITKEGERLETSLTALMEHAEAAAEGTRHIVAVDTIAASEAPRRSRERRPRPTTEPREPDQPNEDDPTHG